MGRLIVPVLVVAGLFFLVRFLMRSNRLFEIRVEGDGVRLRGSVPGYSNGEVVEFIAGLRLIPGARILGLPDGRSFRIGFNADVPPGLQQRIRNYLLLKK